MAMNKTDKARSVNDEIELLLPWYITGKLTRADIVRVETYLDQYPDARKRMKLLHAERDETIMLNRSGNTKPATSPNQLLNQIVGAKQRGKSQLLQWIDGRLRTPFGGWRHWAGAAAMLLIMIQAGAIYMLAEIPRMGNIVRRLNHLDRFRKERSCWFSLLRMRRSLISRHYCKISI